MTISPSLLVSTNCLNEDMVVTRTRVVRDEDLYRVPVLRINYAPRVRSTQITTVIGLKATISRPFETASLSDSPLHRF